MYKRRTDSNHIEIKRAFESVPGFQVFDASKAGNGFPDLVVCCGWLNVLVEVKTEQGRYTQAQIDFNARWTGTRFTIRDTAGVETCIKWMRTVSGLIKDKK